MKQLKAVMVSDKLAELSKTISKEIHLQEMLLNFANAQSEMLLSDNHKEIAEYARSMEQIALKIRKLEVKNRRILLALFDDKLNREPTVADIILNKDIEERFRDDIGQKLSKMADILRKTTLVNYRNALLIKQSMEVQSFETKLLTDKLGGSNVYGSSGRLDSSEDNYFLDQQV